MALTLVGEVVQVFVDGKEEVTDGVKHFVDEFELAALGAVFGVGGCGGEEE